jgi:ankyrin repeat protein
MSKELMVAVSKSDIKKVANLLKNGVNSNSFDSDGRNALFYCCDSKMTDFLLESGVNPNVISDDGHTPLHEAESANVVISLLKGGANPNIPGVSGKTPIFKHKNTDILKALLENGADPDIPDYEGNTSLSNMTPREFRENKNWQLLVAHNAKVDNSMLEYFPGFDKVVLARDAVARGDLDWIKSNITHVGDAPRGEKDSQMPNKFADSPDFVDFLAYTAKINSKSEILADLVKKGANLKYPDAPERKISASSLRSSLTSQKNASSRSVSAGIGAHGKTERTFDR